MKKKIAQACIGTGGLGFAWLFVFTLLSPSPAKVCVFGASAVTGLLGLVLVGLWLQGVFD